MILYLFFVVTYFDMLKQMDGRRPFGDTNTLNRRKRHSYDLHDNQAVQNGMFMGSHYNCFILVLHIIHKP